MLRPKLFKINVKLTTLLFICGVFLIQYYLVQRIPREQSPKIRPRPSSNARFQMPGFSDQESSSVFEQPPESHLQADNVQTSKERSFVPPAIVSAVQKVKDKLSFASESKEVPSVSLPSIQQHSSPKQTQEKLPVYCSNPVDYVNLLMGTASSFEHSIGNTLPLVSRPWGFNSWSLQTRSSNQRPPGGWFFHPSDRDIHGGMRCTHQPSPWLGDYLNFNVFGSSASSLTGRRFNSSSLLLKPHHVSTIIEEAGGNVKMEMTPTMHGAAFRFTFPPGVSRFIGIDNGEVTSISEKEVRIRLPHHDTPELVLEIVAESSVAAAKQSKQPFFWEFPSDKNVIEFRLSTSLISSEVAKSALEREMPWALSFDDLVLQGAHEWNELLSRVCASGFVGTDATIFYTNLWRTLLFPRFSDEDVGSAVKHRSPYNKAVSDGPMVTDSGFWDAFSTVYPWLSLSYTPVLGEMIQGWVNSYKESGWLPTWASPYQRGVMVGTMGDATLADAIAKNITGFDRKTALAAIVKDGSENGAGENGRTCVDEYQRLGYVSNNCGGNSAVGRSLYYYTADAAIAKAARALGEEETAKRFEAYAMSYPKQFNKDSGFFQPKDSFGNFVGGFNSRQWQAGFTEGSAEQYRFNIPFDVPGLNKLMDGKICENVKRLLTLRDKPAFTSHEGAYHEMTEMEGQQSDFGLLSHNNQPSHGALYVAFRAGCYELGEQYVRKVVKMLYTKDAWAGDEDNGEMAAWYMLSTLGMYFLDLGSDEIVLGVPLVTQASILVVDQSTGRAHTLRIDAAGNSESAQVQKVTWTDTKGIEMLLLTRLMSYQNLTKGGTLKFYFR